MNKRLNAIGFALIAWGRIAPLQAEPLARLPEGNISYQIEITSKPTPTIPEKEKPDSAGTAPEAILMTRAKVSRFEKTVRYQLTWSNKKSTEIWELPEEGISINQNIRSGQVYVDRGGLRRLPPLAQLDDKALSWINPKNQQEKGETIYGKKCLFFKDQVTVYVGGGNAPETAIYSAWIDPETRLPVALDDGDARYKFIFGDAAPTTPLVMPPAFQAELDRYRAIMTKPKRL